MHRNTLVIVHGESERILVNAIKSRLRIPVDLYPIDRGSGTVDLPNIAEVLSSGPFKSESALHRAYDALDYEPRSVVKMPDLHIFPILDVDRHRDLFPSYRTKDMFRGSVFSDRIVPIYNDRDLDEIMEAIGFTINRSDKVNSYLKAANGMDVRDMYNRLKAIDGTNLELFLLWMLSKAPPYCNQFRAKAEIRFSG
jgi:hypothetical protein